jgi:hypothetical protein
VSWSEDLPDRQDRHIDLYLSEHAISIAVANRFNAGVPVRLLGDRGSIFETDPNTRKEFYWLASQGVPIRLRYNPNWYPEIVHWKATIFSGQNLVEFGSANYTPVELAPVSTNNYKDETVLFSDDPAIVKAFKTKFDQMWNDTPEANSAIVGLSSSRTGIRRVPSERLLRLPGAMPHPWR